MTTLTIQLCIVQHNASSVSLHNLSKMLCELQMAKVRKAIPEEFSSISYYRSTTYHRLHATRSLCHAPAATFKDLTQNMEVSITKLNRHPGFHFLNQSETKIQFVLTLFKHNVSIPDCSQCPEAINSLRTYD